MLRQWRSGTGLIAGINRRCASTHFGFESVEEKEKEEKVRQVFSGVANKYDLMNDVMSGGIHRLWKDYFIQSLPIRSDAQILDVAGGTGDIAMRAIDRFKRCHVTVCDINEDMLRVGEEKARADPKVDSSRLKWIQGDGEKLPFEDNSFDAFTISFGIRNCTHVDKVVSEAHRVLRPNGLFACLEFSRIHPSLSWLYDTYSFQVIPIMGQVIAGDYNSYKYLVESIRRFPSQDEFASLISSTGLRDVRYENLSFGICAIHTARK